MSTNGEIHKQEESDIIRAFLPYMIFIVVVDIIALMFGIAFFLIVHGIAMGMLRQAHHWQPARRFVERVTSSHFMQQRSASSTAHIYNVFHRILWMTVAVAFIGFGFWLLIDKGFYEQNIIWQICNM